MVFEINPTTINHRYTKKTNTHNYINPKIQRCINTILLRPKIK